MARFIPAGFHLYLQELSALARARYLWYALAGLYGIFLFFMVGPGVRELEVYLQTVYLIAPAVLAPVAALQFSGPRASRFVQAVYTAPVRQSTYFMAKVAVLLSAAVFYYLATMPMLVLHWMHVGVPHAYVDYLLAGALLLLFAIAFGSFIGIVFTGRTVAAPVTVSLLPFLLLFGIPLVFDVQERLEEGLEIATWKTLGLRLLHLGPHINIVEIFGFVSSGRLVEDPGLVLTIFLVSMVGLLATAFWIYLMHQSTETWKDSAVARTLVLCAAVLFLILPVLPPVATSTEDPNAPGAEDLHLLESGRYFTNAQLVLPGDDPVPGFPAPRLPIDQTVERDLYLTFYSLGENSSYTDVTVVLEETPGIRIEGADNVTIGFEDVESVLGDRMVAVRLPLVIEAYDGDALTHIQFRIPVHTNVTIEETSENTTTTRYAEGLKILFASAEVPGAVGKAWIAGGMLPVAFLLIGITRDIRRR